MTTPPTTDLIHALRAAFDRGPAAAPELDALLGEAVAPRPRWHPGALLGTVAAAAVLALLLVAPLSLFAGDGLVLHHPPAITRC